MSSWTKSVILKKAFPKGPSKPKFPTGQRSVDAIGRRRWSTPLVDANVAGWASVSSCSKPFFSFVHHSHEVFGFVPSGEVSLLRSDFCVAFRLLCESSEATATTTTTTTRTKRWNRERTPVRAIGCARRNGNFHRSIFVGPPPHHRKSTASSIILGLGIVRYRLGGGWRRRRQGLLRCRPKGCRQRVFFSWCLLLFGEAVS